MEARPKAPPTIKLRQVPADSSVVVRDINRHKGVDRLKALDPLRVLGKRKLQNIKVIIL